MLRHARPRVREKKEESESWKMGRLDSFLQSARGKMKGDKVVGKNSLVDVKNLVVNPKSRLTIPELHKRKNDENKEKIMKKYVGKA